MMEYKNYTAECPIWGTPARQIPIAGDAEEFDSPRTGGTYRLTGSAAEAVKNTSGDSRFPTRLTDWLIQERRSGIPRPQIDSYLVQDVQERRIGRDRGIMERADAVLEYLAGKVNRLGGRVTYDEKIPSGGAIRLTAPGARFYELLACSGSVDYQELVFLLEYLEQQRYIDWLGKNNLERACALTVPGHARLEDLKLPHVDSTKAFIAMWFDDSMTGAWQNGMEPAIQEAGYEPVRIDQQEHIGKIDDQIIAEIRRSRFVVADFTQGDEGARGGVYYEAGFAHGLHIPVIFTCRKDKLGQVHFDTRQYNHITWQDPGELKEALKSRILAVLGKGSWKQDSP